MRPGALIPLAAALMAGCGKDEDKDGFKFDEDCDDTNAAIYPGADETVGDGVDSNCDGDDPQHPFVGDWDLTKITALTEGYDIFEGYTTAGSLEVGLDLNSVVAITMTDETDTYAIDLTGAATPSEAEGAFSLNLSGKISYGGVDQYDATAQWQCTTAATLDCKGTFIVDGDAFDTTASFTAK